MRVTVDTNVWVSAVLTQTGPPARVRTAFEQQRFTLIASEPLLLELARVLARPRLVRKYRLESDDVADLLASVRALGEMAVVRGEVHVCRDPTDDMVIETAINGGADMLVSRDDDLKRAPEVVTVLAERGVRVLTVQQFLDALDEAGAPAST